MRNVALASFQLHLVYLSAADQCEQTPSGHVCVAPICQAELDIILRFQREGKAGPG